MMPAPFDQVRERLERQYLDADFDRASGLSRDELLAEFNRHCADNPDEPRIITRAWLFHLLCSRARIAMEPDDYFAGKLQHHDLLIDLRNQWRAEEERREFADDPPAIEGAWSAILDTGHTCPDWHSLLEHGFTGLRDRATAGSGPFYQAVAMVYEAAVILCKRFARALPDSPVAALAQRPPQTFQEALQLAYLYHELQEMEDGYSVRSMGRFDVLYNDFYVSDLRSGRISRDQAKELLKYFWIKFYAKTQGKLYGKPFLFGPDANEMSHLAFEVYREMQIVDPKLHVRISRDTPRDFFEQVVACIRAGCTGIVTVNDTAQVQMLCDNGKTRRDAEDYILIGCYEPAVMGKELNCSGACKVNLAKAVELVLSSGDHGSFGELMAAYLDVLDAQILRAVDRARREERLWPQVNPSPLLSGTMASCMGSGLDVSEAGAEYNTTGCLCLGLANAVDSLAVIKHVFYEDGCCTLKELRAALAANWDGHEQLRLVARNRVPKWGNNDDRVDAIAVEITDFLAKRINNEPNARGGVFQAALYGIIDIVKRFGSATGALPDGRLAGEPLTMNTGPTTGMDKRGITALINSVTKLDLSGFPNGTVLDIMLHPSVVGGANGIAVLCSIIESHFARGGMAIQFNIFDADLLREAQRSPENFANLQVRVCGWNVRFIDLAHEEQEMFITKAEAT
ncbi:MAG: pyruvate formate lyase family protein [Armatimonadota bacterium]